jgi:hypothetical protein
MILSEYTCDDCDRVVSYTVWEIKHWQCRIFPGQLLRDEFPIRSWNV